MRLRDAIEELLISKVESMSHSLLFCHFYFCNSFYCNIRFIPSSDAISRSLSKPITNLSLVYSMLSATLQRNLHNHHLKEISNLQYFFPLNLATFRSNLKTKWFSVFQTDCINIVVFTNWFKHNNNDSCYT